MKNFYPKKLKFNFYSNPLKKTIDPFVFWEIVVSVFFVGLVLVSLVHLQLFYSLGSLSLSQSGSEKTNSFLDQKKLEAVATDLEKKQENFSRYFGEKPKFADPSLTN